MRHIASNDNISTGYFFPFTQAGASITADVLILQAGVEIFVENAAMGTFFSSLG